MYVVISSNKYKKKKNIRMTKALSMFLLIHLQAIYIELYNSDVLLLFIYLLCACICTFLKF